MSEVVLSYGSAISVSINRVLGYVGCHGYKANGVLGKVRILEQRNVPNPNISQCYLQTGSYPGAFRKGMEADGVITGTSISRHSYHQQLSHLTGNLFVCLKTGHPTHTPCSSGTAEALSH